MRTLPLSSLVLLLLSSPAGTAAGADVAVILSAKVGAYQEAVRGFRESQSHRIVASYDMKGEFERGREILAEIETEVRPDLIFAVGVWALQLIAAEGSELPVIYAMVLNPPTVVGSEQTHITGASMNVSVEDTLRLFKQLSPEIRRVGALFSEESTGYLIRDASEAARQAGLELVAEEIDSSREAISALNALQERGMDALWILPDEATLAPRVMEHLLLFSYRKKVPLIGLSERHAEMGALLSVSFASSEDIGRQAAELAGRILEEDRGKEVPFTRAREVNLVVNLKTARKLGLEVPESLVSMASTVIR